MICDKRTSIVLPFSESKMFPRREERESERQMEDRELENICKSSIYSKVGGRTRDSIFLEEIYPSGKEFEEFQPPAVCRFNRGGCRFNETIESRFSAEKWATREDEKFTRSRMPPPIPLLDKFSFSFFFSTSHVELVVSRIEYTPFDYPRFLNPFFDTCPDSSSTFLLSFPISRSSFPLEFPALCPRIVFKFTRGRRGELIPIGNNQGSKARNRSGLSDRMKETMVRFLK